MDDFAFTNHKDRVLKCLADIADAYLQSAQSLNELRAILLEAEHNRRVSKNHERRG